jgi:outer membrane protein OmpA-like peptidoglycan-associated protein
VALGVAVLLEPVPLSPAGTSTPPGASAPVVTLTAPVVDIVFAEGTTDGALIDLGHRQFRLSADVLFAFDKAELTARANTLLAQVASAIRSQSVSVVTVSGFTDSVGTPAYNLGLSRRRAEAVATALRARLGPGVTIRAAGFGEDRPVSDNGTDRGRALNRRVEIRLG